MNKRSLGFTNSFLPVWFLHRTLWCDHWIFSHDSNQWSDQRLRNKKSSILNTPYFWRFLLHFAAEGILLCMTINLFLLMFLQNFPQVGRCNYSSVRLLTYMDISMSNFQFSSHWARYSWDKKIKFSGMVAFELTVFYTVLWAHHRWLQLSYWLMMYTREWMKQASAFSKMWQTCWNAKQ